MRESGDYFDRAKNRENFETLKFQEQIDGELLEMHSKSDCFVLKDEIEKNSEEEVLKQNLIDRVHISNLLETDAFDSIDDFIEDAYTHDSELIIKRDGMHFLDFRNTSEYAYADIIIIDLFSSIPLEEWGMFIAKIKSVFEDTGIDTLSDEELNELLKTVFNDPDLTNFIEKIENLVKKHDLSDKDISNLINDDLEDDDEEKKNPASWLVEDMELNGVNLENKTEIEPIYFQLGKINIVELLDWYHECKRLDQIDNIGISEVYNNELIPIEIQHKFANNVSIYAEDSKAILDIDFNHENYRDVYMALDKYLYHIAKTQNIGEDSESGYKYLVDNFVENTEKEYLLEEVFAELIDPETMEINYPNYINIENQERIITMDKEPSEYDSYDEYRNAITSQVGKDNTYINNGEEYAHVEQVFLPNEKIQEFNAHIDTEIIREYLNEMMILLYSEMSLKDIYLMSKEVQMVKEKHLDSSIQKDLEFNEEKKMVRDGYYSPFLRAQISILNDKYKPLINGSAREKRIERKDLYNSFKESITNEQKKDLQQAGFTFWTDSIQNHSDDEKYVKDLGEGWEEEKSFTSDSFSLEGAEVIYCNSDKDGYFVGIRNADGDEIVSHVDA